MLLGVAAVACRTPDAGPINGLAVDVASLKLHLRDDSYRSFNHIDPEGRNFFQETRWKIERLQRQRAATSEEWTFDDYVIELARARVLERLHRYRLAHAAYSRVASGPTELSDGASRAADALSTFVRLALPLPAKLDDEQQLADIGERIAAWTALADASRGGPYASLALEEAESWEALRVSLLARGDARDEAIEACESMIERHRASKLYPLHLMQLGDLHAGAAREIAILARAQQDQLRTTDYQAHVDAALSAYELASEARLDAFRRQAQRRAQALVSYHDGVMDGLY